MNVFSNIEALVRDSLGALMREGTLPGGLDMTAINVETPRDPSHGDLSTNAAMVLAKPARMKPRDIADKLVAKLATDPRVTAASVAGPGFINLTLDACVWRSQITQILTEGAGYGRMNAATSKASIARRSSISSRFLSFC